MNALQILKLAETLVTTLKGVDRTSALGALHAAIDAIMADVSTAAVVD